MEGNRRRNQTGPRRSMEGERKLLTVRTASIYRLIYIPTYMCTRCCWYSPWCSTSRPPTTAKKKWSISPPKEITYNTKERERLLIRRKEGANNVYYNYPTAAGVEEEERKKGERCSCMTLALHSRYIDVFFILIFSYRPCALYRGCQKQDRLLPVTLLFSGWGRLLHYGSMEAVRV